MIRVIQRRLIIPRGDTGIFTIPAMTQAEGAIGVFTIFDPITNTRIFQKQVEIEGENFNISFSHADTVNLKAGDYLWDIKFYKNPILADNKVIDGEEINSYYAAFLAPKCEIRETGDDFLMIEGQPAKIEDLNIILAATEAANAAKVAATEQAGIAAIKAEEAAAKLEEMMAAMPTKVSELENDSGYLQEETDPTIPAWAKAQTKPIYTAQEVGALPSNTFIPSKVSDLTDDSGHYVKPANGIPASDLEDTYVKFTDYATTETAGVIKILSPLSGGLQMADNSIKIYPALNTMIKQGLNNINPIVPSTQDRSTFYGLAKAAGSDEKNSNLPVGQYTDAAKAAIQQMLGVPSAADIPTNVSELTNDAGYLTEHQDISGKANSADLAAVATSGSYEDLNDKPTIPEVPVQDVQINGSSILNNGVANIQPAINSQLGVVRINSNLGISIADNQAALGQIQISPANSQLIKNPAGDTIPQTIQAKYKPITPYKQHESAFYGLAKAAGDTTQSQSNNAVGTYTDDAKTAIQTMLDVPSTFAVTSEIAAAIGNINSFDMAVVQELPTQDISTHTIYLVPKTGETNDVYDEYVYINDAWEMVGNTQIDLSNYVQKTDYATVDNAGVVKVSSTFGIGIDDNDKKLYTNKATFAQIKSGKNAYTSIVPANQHESAFYALAKAAGDTTQSQSSNAVGTYTDEAKAAIQQMLDVPSNGDIPDVPVQDVQVNGISVLDAQGVAEIPNAGEDTYGLVRGSDIPVQPGSGLGSIEGKPIVVGSNVYLNTASARASVALGEQAKATGVTSMAFGHITEAIGPYSFAEGQGTKAVGPISHAEGSSTIAIGDGSHSEGSSGVTYGISSHFEGIAASDPFNIKLTSTNDSTKYLSTSIPAYICIGTYIYIKDNISAGAIITDLDRDNNIITLDKTLGVLNEQACDARIGVAIGRGTHAEGLRTIANGVAQHVQGKANAVDTNDMYADIVGNGATDWSGVRSNAYALTWTGDGHYAGDVYVHSNTDSSGGERLAKESELGLKVVRLI